MNLGLRLPVVNLFASLKQGKVEWVSPGSNKTPGPSVADGRSFLRVKSVAVLSCFARLFLCVIHFLNSFPFSLVGPSLRTFRSADLAIGLGDCPPPLPLIGVLFHKVSLSVPCTLMDQLLPPTHSLPGLCFSHKECSSRSRSLLLSTSSFFTPAWHRQWSKGCRGATDRVSPCGSSPVCRRFVSLPACVCFSGLSKVQSVRSCTRGIIHLPKGPAFRLSKERQLPSGASYSAPPQVTTDFSGRLELFQERATFRACFRALSTRLSVLYPA